MDNLKNKCCTKDNMVWCPVSQRYECMACGMQYSEEELENQKESQTINMQDMSGKPRSEKDLIDAREAIKRSIVVDNPQPIMVHYPVIMDAIDELIEARRAISVKIEDIKETIDMRTKGIK